MGAARRGKRCTTYVDTLRHNTGANTAELLMLDRKVWRAAIMESRRTGAAKPSTETTLNQKPKVAVVEPSQLVRVEAPSQVVLEQAADISTKEAFSDTLLPVEDIDAEDSDISCQSSIQEVTMSDVTDEDVISSENQLSSEELITSIVEDTDTDGDDLQQDDSPCLEGPEPPVVTPSKCDGDTEAVTGAQQEEARVDVVFKGTVTLHGCCQMVTEILKCVLYQRQQLPMPYEQLKTCQASKQNEEEACCRSVQSADLGWRKRERNLQELDVLLEQLEELFCLSQVPRVLLLLGGSLVLPKEVYDINMEALTLSSVNQSLQVSTCLQQLCRTLLVADILSDTAPVHLTSTRVLVLAHRECGVDWFRPQLNFKVPTRAKKQVIALSSDTAFCRCIQTEMPDWKDYVWFQAPTAIKGFSS